MTTDRNPDAHYAILHPDGRAIYGGRDRGRTLRDELADHIPNLSSQGLGRLRMWFSDDFCDPHMAPNTLADDVVTRLGYRHPFEWRGPVGLTMEEDVTGDIAPLSATVHATVDELVALAQGADDWWIAAERHAPELLDVLMYMNAIEIDGRVIHQYKHADTRRYLNIDTAGQAWQITSHGAELVNLASAKAYVRGIRDLRTGAGA